MSKQEIIEIIAVFMGYQILHKEYQYANSNSSGEFYYDTEEGNIVCDKNGNEVNLYPDGNPLFSLEELPFDREWNWLMEVVEKIESLGYMVEIIEKYCRIKFNDNRVWSDYGTKFLSTYHEVVEFIKWYNEH